MTRLKHYILPPENLHEAAYHGNIGFEEMVEFMRKATKKQIEEMKLVTLKGDWDAFTKLIQKVTGTKLK